MRTTYSFGIDLGTTNSVLAVCNEGQVEVVKLEFNNEVTPSAVYIESPDNVVVGRSALPSERGFDHPDRSAREFKREMGQTTYSGQPKPMEAFPQPRVERDLDWSAQDLATEVLKYIRRRYKEQYGEEIQYAVITVPVDFAGAADNATQKAARAAGFTEVRLEREPAMAAYGYLNHPTIRRQVAEQPGPWLVYDLGGGTFDATLLEVRPEEAPRIVDHVGNRELGGKNFDASICNELLRHVVEQLKTGLPECEKDERFPELKARLLHLAEEAKIRLSRNERKEDGSVQIDGLPLQIREQLVLAGFSVGNTFRNYTFSYKQLADLVEDRINLSLEICQSLVKKHGFELKDIKKVLLIGGPTDALYIKDALEKVFPGEGRVNRIRPFTMVSEGAALYAQGIPIPASHADSPKAFWIDWMVKRVVKQPSVLVRGTLKSPLSEEASGKFTIQFADKNSPALLPELVVSPGAQFSCELPLSEGPNHFVVHLRGRNGNSLQLEEVCRTLDIFYDPKIVITEPVNSHTIGLEIADNQMLPIVRRGEQRSEEEIKRELETIKEFKSGEWIHFILREGDQKSAKRNLEIGRVSIEAPHPLKKGGRLQLTVKPSGASCYQASACALGLPPGLDGQTTAEAHTQITLGDQPIPTIDDLLKSFNELGDGIERCRQRRSEILPKVEGKITELAKLQGTAWDFDLILRHFHGIDDPSVKSRINALEAELSELEKARQEVRHRLLELEGGRSVRNAPTDIRKEARGQLARLLSECDEIEIALKWIDSIDSSGRAIGELEHVFGQFIFRASDFYRCNRPGERNATPDELDNWLRIWKEVQKAVRERDRMRLDKLHWEMEDLYWKVRRRSVARVPEEFKYRNDEIYRKRDLANKPGASQKWGELQGAIGSSGEITPQNVQRIGQLLTEFDQLYCTEGGTKLSTIEKTEHPTPNGGAPFAPI